MTDDLTTYGLGALDSPPDERDWDVASLYELTGADAAPLLPAAYTAPPPWPPILNQHATPMCVAYSSSTLKGWEDLRDQGAFDFDEPLFFDEIGGTASGAYIRQALDRLLSVGYPVVTIGNRAQHRITAYYRVGISETELKTAILAFGPILLSLSWPHSWFRPVGGILPGADYNVGGHAIIATGWGASGLRLRNSWGTTWGLSGEAIMPWYHVGQIKEAWKAVDQIVVPPRPRAYRVNLAAHALVRVAEVNRAGRITGWRDPIRWGDQPSSAPCKRPRIKRGVRSGQALVALVTAGVFKGKWISVTSRGVTVTSKETA